MALPQQTIAIVNKINQFEHDINANFIGRKREIRSVILALVSGQHTVLVGKAGTAKSAIANVIFNNIEDSTVFNRQLTPFSTPEELFGALDLAELKKGVYSRNVNGMLPTADFAVLDEVFKASSSILNSLLSILQERTYDNGTSKLYTPLKTVVGLSNEYPQDDTLEALFDRFILRVEVDYLKDSEDFAKMLVSGRKKINKITVNDINDLHFVRDNVVINENIITSIVLIRDELIANGVQVSDRRFKHSLAILQASALLRGSDVVENEDLEVLIDCLWKDIEERPTVEEVVSKFTSDPVMANIKELVKQADEVFVNLSSNMRNNNEAEIEMRVALKDIEQQLHTLKGTFQSMWNEEYQEALDKAVHVVSTKYEASMGDSLSSLGFD